MNTTQLASIMSFSYIDAPFFFQKKIGARGRSHPDAKERVRAFGADRQLQEEAEQAAVRIQGELP